MATKEGIGTVQLTLKGVTNWRANEATETQRLRAALKCLLRQFGLRVTAVDWPPFSSRGNPLPGFDACEVEMPFQPQPNGDDNAEHR